MILRSFCILLLSSAWSIAQDTPRGNADGFRSNPISVPFPTATDFFGNIPFVVDDGSSENSIGDDSPFLFLNRFTPGAESYPFRLDEVQVFWASTYISVGDEYSVYIYDDQDGDPATGLNLLASYRLTVNTVDGFDIHPLQDGPVITSGDVLVGVVNRIGGTGANEFPAVLDETVSQGRSWAGSYTGEVADPPVIPADNGFGTIDSFGFPGNWMIRASGTLAGTVPTLSEYGMLALVLALLGAAMFMMRRNQSLKASS